MKTCVVLSNMKLRFVQCSNMIIDEEQVQRLMKLRAEHLEESLNIEWGVEVGELGAGVSSASEVFNSLAYTEKTSTIPRDFRTSTVHVDLDHEVHVGNQSRSADVDGTAVLEKQCQRC